MEGRKGRNMCEEPTLCQVMPNSFTLNSIYCFTPLIHGLSPIWVFPESVGCRGTSGPFLDTLALTTIKTVSFMVPKICLLKINPLSSVSAKLIVFFPNCQIFMIPNLLAKLVRSLDMRAQRFQLMQLYLLSHIITGY